MFASYTTAHTHNECRQAQAEGVGVWTCSNNSSNLVVSYQDALGKGRKMEMQQQQHQ